MNATLNETLADLETISLDELNERAAMLTRVDRKYALDAATASSILSRLPEDTRVLQIAGQVSQGYASTYYDTPTVRRFSLRSTDLGVDVSEIARFFGGGGHRNAAGFEVPRDHELARC